MRRLGTTVAAALAIGLVIALSGASSGDDANARVRYVIELDNAFGLIEGADVKIAGVRAGRIEDMDLDRTDMRALIKVSIDREGFGDLRADSTCETKPQSLIGEYFVDCDPGTSARKLADGALVPVERTTTTVPVDLVNNILRRPYRERFSIIFAELGGALAARGPDLNETIRRASPALREVNRVLAILRTERRTIRDLYADADAVVGSLADNRKDVTRFVAQARDTAAVGAARPAAVRRQLRALPPFFTELQQTMPLLGEAARRQTGALRTLSTQAPLLRRFLDRLGPFAEASRPAVRTLGDAAKAGRPAVIAARPRLAELASAAKELPELGGNLALVLEHLDNRKKAVEKDPRSPGGQGFTGFEALLRYVYAQTQSVNLFDSSNYILKVSGFLDADCGFYQNAVTARSPKQQRCAAILGPGRPGIDEPDPTKTTTAAARRRVAARRPSSQGPGRAPSAPAAGVIPSSGGATDGAGQPSAAPAPAAIPDAVKPFLDFLMRP